MYFMRLILILACVIVLSACGEEAPEQQAAAPVSQSSTANDQAQTVTNPSSASASKSAGGVTVKIIPENPTSTGCLRAIIQGEPGRSAVIWKVNNERVSSGNVGQLCGDNYKSGDNVTVVVGTNEKGAQASVTIANSPPRIIDISSTPEEIFAGTDISVTPMAEDADGDDVDFTYQWLINGEEDPLMTASTLPGEKFTKGDTVQVLIVPNDFYDDGPTYKSFVTSIPNAAPVITSQPPEGISSLEYQYQVEASDPDDNQFTYRLDEAPAGMSIDETSGLIKWSLMDVNPGEYIIAIVVTDPDGAEGAQEYKLTLGEPK